MIYNSLFDEEKPFGEKWSFDDKIEKFMRMGYGCQMFLGGSFRKS